MNIVRIPESMVGLAERLGRIPTPEEAFWMFMQPIRTAVARKEKEWESMAARFNLRSEGERVEGYSWGHGKIVVLAHGWNGRALSMSAFIGPLVERGFQVVAIDAPGHGESEGNICHAPRFADCIAQIQEKIGPIHGVIGHSFGTIATTVAQARGVAIEKAVYLSALCWIPQRFREFAAAVGLCDNGADQMWKIADDHFGPGQIEKLNADVAASDFSACALLVHDEEDREVPIEDSEAIAKVWKGSELWRVRGLGHFRILRSRSVIERVVQFLDG